MASTKGHHIDVAQILEQRKPVRDVNSEHDESLTRLERLAMFITDHVGTMGFFFLIFLWTAFWLGWNFFAPASMKFDPPMGFVFWLFISNMIQILLMPLIMVGQNLQGRHAERRAENDYDVNVRAEREIAAILIKLDRVGLLLDRLAKKEGIDPA
jgi:uncharacterized membrane protein